MNDNTIIKKVWFGSYFRNAGFDFVNIGNISITDDYVSLNGKSQLNLLYRILTLILILGVQLYIPYNIWVIAIKLSLFFILTNYFFLKTSTLKIARKDIIETRFSNYFTTIKIRFLFSNNRKKSIIFRVYNKQEVELLKGLFEKGIRDNQLSSDNDNKIVKKYRLFIILCFFLIFFITFIANLYIIRSYNFDLTNLRIISFENPSFVDNNQNDRLEETAEENFNKLKIEVANKVKRDLDCKTKYINFLENDIMLWESKIFFSKQLETCIYAYGVSKEIDDGIASHYTIRGEIITLDNNEVIKKNLLYNDWLDFINKLNE